MKDIEFLHPYFFWLLLLVPAFIFWYWYKHREQFVELSVPSIKPFLTEGTNMLPVLRNSLFALKVIAFIFLVTALARPRTSAVSEKKITAEGIDIVMAIDVSTSMLAKDFEPNRMEAAKKVALEFIEGRPNDRVGLVVYAGESFTQCPLTSDHAIIKNLMSEVKNGLIEDGTAIGMGLATAVTRLKDSKAKSKVIILLTDGKNNQGTIDPFTAAELAKEFNIRIYTIGVGTQGTAPFPVQDFFGNTVYQQMQVEIDEELLTQIAHETGGKYFRATDNEKLKAIYSEIDQLEKTKLQELNFYQYTEKFEIFALIAGLCLLLEALLRYTVFRNFV